MAAASATRTAKLASIPGAFSKARNQPICRSSKPRSGHQPQDRQDARPHHPGNAVGHCRRGYSMKRRTFIAGLGSAAVWPVVARAQQLGRPIIGVLSGTRPEGYSVQVAGLLRGLAETGYVEGRNVSVEWRWARDQYDQLPMLAADLVQRRVDVIVAIGSARAPFAAKAATATIPIIFALGSDPVELGLVDSLNRPGGNITGTTMLGRELLQKRLEILRTVVPGTTTIGLL